MTVFLCVVVCVVVCVDVVVSDGCVCSLST